MTKIYASLFFALFIVSTAGAQVRFLFSDATAAGAGDTVSVDISVRNFNDIQSFQTSVNWDPSKFVFGNVSNITTELPDFVKESSIGTPPNAVAVNEGQLSLLWADATTLRSLPDDTRLFTLHLVATGSQCDRITIDLGRVPRATEVVDGSGSDIGASSTPGTLLIDDGSRPCTDAGGGDAVELSIGSISSPKGSTVCLPIRATNFDSIENFQFGLIWDPSVLSLATDAGVTPEGNGIKEGVLTKVAVNNTDASQGRLRVVWSIQSDAVSAGSDDVLFEVCFNVIGDLSSNTTVDFASFPNVSPPFRIEVSNTNEEVEVKTRPGTVTVGNGQIKEGVGFIFEDIYTEGASSICIPLKVESFDSLVAFMVGVSFDDAILKYTGSQNEVTGLQVVSSSSNNNELRVLWSDGNANPVSIDDGETVVELCFDVLGTDGAKSAVGVINIPPNFAIEVLKFPSRTTQYYVEAGSITVGNAPEPVDTVMIIASNEVFAMDDTVCVDFSVNNFSGIEAMSFVVTWDETILSYVGPRNTNLPTLTEGESNFRFVTPNKVRVLHTPTSAQTVPDGTVIFQMCYTAIPDCDSEASTDIMIGGDSNVRLELLKDSKVVAVATTNGSAKARPCSTGDGIVINATQIRNPTCAGATNGSIVIDVENAIGSFTCSWTRDGQSIVTDNCLLNGVGAGEYTVTVKDDLDSTATATYTLSDPTPVTISNANIIVCPVDDATNGEVEFVFSGGDGSYTITESGAGTVDGLKISGLRAAEFTFIVADGNGCDFMITYPGMVDCGKTGPIGSCDEARIVISPNNDGINDEFTIACLNDPAERDKVNRLAVYNRWGELVYSQSQYANDWIGVSSDGDQLPEGGYMWVFEIGDSNNRATYRGTLTILR